MDATRKTRLNVFEDLDSELRVIYVAITRTRKNLYLVDSKDGNGYDKIFEAVRDEFDLDF